MGFSASCAATNRNLLDGRESNYSMLALACCHCSGASKARNSVSNGLLCTTNSRQIEFTTAVGALAKQSRKFAAQKQELALCRQHEPCAAHEDSAEAGDAHDEGRQEDQSRARAAEST
eukprot:18424-Heterococcus_DN1.PRE.2